LGDGRRTRRIDRRLADGQPSGKNKFAKDS
jgi:hypothetical protein